MRYVFGAILMAIAFGFQLKMIFVFRQMMDDVNGRLPDASKVPEIGGSWWRGRVIRYHKEFFPANGLSRRLYRLWYIEMAAFMAALACFIRF